MGYRFLLPIMLWAQLAHSQHPSTASRLEQLLTERGIYAHAYARYFRFEERPTPRGFTYVVEASDRRFYRHEAALSNIASMDICGTDSSLVLAVTFREPLSAKATDTWMGPTLAEQPVSVLAFPITSWKQGTMIKAMFGDIDPVLRHRIRQASGTTAPPECVAIPTLGLAFGKYPVTVAEYRGFSEAMEIPMPLPPPWGWRGDHPVVGLSLGEAEAYCSWLSDHTAEYYRLPTLGEWQQAAGGGRKANGTGSLDDTAWWGENAGETTQPVGQKTANAFGLHDLLGNAWEWVEAGETAAGSAAGGSWDSHFEQCQWNSTTELDKGARDFTVGFRAVKVENLDEQP